MANPLVNSKHAFWQALIVTIAIFVIGIFLGIVIEGKRADEASERFIESEISLMDSLALSNLAQASENNPLSCDILIEANINFADRVYNEALSIEDYGAAERLTDNVGVVLKRYDLMRTILWINVMEIPDECMEETSVVVYLFDRNAENLEEKSLNKVWERVLFYLKSEKGEEIILIPINADMEFISLNSLLSEFNITKTPAVIIDNEHVIKETMSVDDLKGYLK